MSVENVSHCLSVAKCEAFRGTEERQLEPLFCFTQGLILPHRFGSSPGTSSGQSGHCLGVCQVIVDSESLLEAAARVLVSEAIFFFLLRAHCNTKNFIVGIGSTMFWPYIKINCPSDLGGITIAVWTSVFSCVSK